MGYCFGCQPYFLKATYEGGAVMTLAFPSIDAAVVNALQIVHAFEKCGRWYMYVINRKNENVYQITDINGNIIKHA